MPQLDTKPSTGENSLWVGKQEEKQDVISLQLSVRLAALFDEACPEEGQPLPYLWHWAFFQSPVVEAELGEDGHPARGRFLPPAENRQRMWAGGRVTFHQPLIVGQRATCRSTILAVKEKHGQTGSLLFVTVEHRYFQGDALCISEEQDIVYRELSPPKLTVDRTLPALGWTDTIQPTPVMLFRYSAVTFNGHRIHYDYPYATQQEGYPGLVVHGPMIATLVMRSITRQHPHHSPARLSYRGLRPLIADTPFSIGGVADGAQTCSAWAFNDQGPAHQADVTFKESN